MRTAIRSTGVVITAVVAAALLALTTTVASARAATALMVGGIAAGILPDIVMSNVLSRDYNGKAPDETNWNRVNVVWPAQARPYTGLFDLAMGASIALGTNALEREIRTRIIDDNITVVGMSAGALVADEVLRRLLANPLSPTEHTLNFVIVADSSRQDIINESRYNPIYDYTYQPPPETKYSIKVVTGEYDGAADFPDRVGNLLAVFNAMIGAIFVHIPVMFTDLDRVPAENITTTYNSLGGETKHYLVPTARLPLVQLIPWLAPIEGVLKQWVDSGYSRNDPAAVTSSIASGMTTEIKIESSTQTVDPNGGGLAEPVKTPAEENQGLANATANADEKLDTATKAVSKGATDLTDGNMVSPSTTAGNRQAEEGLDAATKAVSNGATDLTDGNMVSPSTTAGNRQAEEGLDAATKAVSNGATDLTDGNMVSPSTTAGNRQASSGSNTLSTSTTRTPTSTTKGGETSSTKGSDPSSSTSSSSGKGSTK